MAEPLLQVRGLRVAFAEQTVVNGIDFDLFPGETFAMVGESGSGKTLTGLAVMRLLPRGARCSAGTLRLRHEDVMPLSEQQLCRVRGRRIAFIFQDPQSSLNPVMTVGDQVAEGLRLHFELSAQQLHDRVLALLAQVELPEPAVFAKRFPHQLSGGQRQRVMIAMALAGEPELLIADEPTTALDVTLQAQILALLKRLQQQMGMTLWLISHDLALVASLADRIAVMQHGNVVEMAAAKAFFAQPQHPYSQQLVNALPNWQACRDHVSPPQPALLSLDDVRVYYPIRKGVFKRLVGYVKAVDGVSLVVPQGQTVALVGESGCGKSSLAKALLGLIPTTGGRVILDGCDLSTASASVRQQSRAAMQIVFQDPFAAMNPRWLVGAVIEEGMCALRPDMTASQRAERVVALLAQVGLPADAAQRYPHEFSGGQRQRICIARALAVEPKLIICDEPTSALDVSIQAQILALLKQLQQQQGVSYLLITHNWGVVAEMADSVAVMYQGRLVEQGAVATVLQQPQHPYTRQLLEAVPRLA